jgi:hypothetical protein
MIECARCCRPIVEEKGSRLPPWCPHCGADIKARSVALPAVAGDAPAPPPQEPGPSRRELARSLAAAAAGRTVPPSEGEERVTESVEERAPAPELVYLPSRRHVDGIAQPDAPPRATGNKAVLAIAAVLLGVCAVLIYWSLEKVFVYHRADGTVIGELPGRKGRSHPEVAYTVNGAEYKMQGASSSGLFSPGYPVGASVTVLYPSDDPGRGTIARFSDLWLGPLLTGLLGAGCLAFWFLSVRRVVVPPITSTP